MTEVSCEILAGDYDRAGLASRTLKEQLKKIGVAPEIVRRTMIAAYEAEMNVVIHSAGGQMKAVLDDNQVLVEVTDRGPGIPDIERAMTEGFSTAPARARELGFGAGMGLPNIRRNSDRMSIESSAGSPTRVRFSIRLRSQEDSASSPNSLRGLAAKCTQCLRCLHVCPTRALRVRQDEPQILDYLCVDCTSCMSVCPVKALALEGECEIQATADGVVVVPPAFLAQFAPGCTPGQVLGALAELGFGAAVCTDGAEQALRQAVLEFAHAGGHDWPVISPVCPAVLNLIQTKFPSLIKHVAPFQTALEAVREDLAGRRASFVALCPAQKTLVHLGRGPALAHVILPGQLESRLRPLLKKPAHGAAGGPGEGGMAMEDPRILRVGGMAHVVRVLEEMENGRILDDCIVELYSCDEGCFGSPLLRQDPFVSRRHSRQAAAITPAKARRRESALRARPGLRLDANMARAIQKLSQINELLKAMPGKDCGACGAPTCAALAEDVVLGRAELRCPRAKGALK